MPTMAPVNSQLRFLGGWDGDDAAGSVVVTALLVVGRASTRCARGIGWLARLDSLQAAIWYIVA